jgi:hypothetical protein
MGTAEGRGGWCVRADVVFTASAGKCGRGRTSRQTFSAKNVRYDIPACRSQTRTAIQPPHFNRSSQWYGMFQIRYWSPIRGTRDLLDREQYENCWSIQWEYDNSVQALQWVQCSTSYMRALFTTTSQTANIGRSLRQTHKRQ